MAIPNFSSFQGPAGICRIVTLVLGVIVLGMTAYFFAIESPVVRFRLDQPVSTIRRYCFFGVKSTDKDATTTINGFTSTTTVDGPLFSVLLAFVVITFIVSLVLAVLYIVDVLVQSGIIKILDMIYHIIGGGFLILGGIIWIIAELTLDRGEGLGRLIYCSKTQAAFMIIAGILGIADGVVYLAVAFFVWKSPEQQR